MSHFYKGFIVAAAVLLGVLLVTRPGMAAPLTIPEAAIKLEASTAELRTTRFGSVQCTVTKIGVQRFLTARHCVSITTTKLVVYTDDNGVADVTGIFFPTVKKIGQPNPNAQGDYAVLFTSREMENVPALALACDEQLYMGQSVAYYGYGIPLKSGFYAGYVSSMDPATKKQRRSNFDYMISTHVSGGSSGSSVISLDTGNIIGVVIQFVPSNRVGVIGTGVQGIKDLACNPLAGLKIADSAYPEIEVVDGGTGLVIKKATSTMTVYDKNMFGLK